KDRISYINGSTDDADQKLTKEEEVIARFVRFNCATKTTIFEGNEVHYFIGNKAIDLLVESKKYGSAAKNPKFVNRVSAVTFMKVLLSKGLFFRARKLVAKRKENKKGDTSKSPRKRTKEDAEKESESSKEKKEDEKDSDENEDEDEDEKKKRKVKLELHQDQQFNDSNDVYVWVFDPTPFHKQLIGALIVLGTIAGCLFPLWPGWLKKGVYYTSLGGLICFGILLGIKLVDLFGTLKLIKYIKYKNILFFFLLLLTFYILLLSSRTVLFVVIWTATMGRHKLWILPNLTEDCGFFESFQPWYTYEYCPDGIKKRKKGEKKKTGEEPQRGFAYYAAMNYTFYCSELYFILSFKLNIYYRTK
ncbi:unnamed protein product, partial [Dracunculus medinensis]|uniref:Translocation protein SEC62 n=1 Tax=Dracunculus medinensis TaxID=318479 RepID=A0A0N4UIH5_DRAME